MSVRRDAGVNVAANLVLAVLGIGSGSFVAYRLGPEGRGVLGVGQVVVTLGAALGSLGFGDALVYRRARGDAVPAGRVARLAVAAGLGAGALGALVGAAIAGPLDVAPGALACFVGLAAGSTGFVLVPLGAVRGDGRFVAWNALRILSGAWWLASLVAVSSDGELRLVALGLVYGAGQAVIGTVALRVDAVTPVAVREAPTPTLSALLRFGLPAALSAGPLLLNARVDQLMLAPAATTTALGQYVAAASYCFAVVPLGQALANLATTRVAERSGPAQAEVLRRIVGTGVTLVVVAAAVAAAAAGFAVRLLNGPGFGPSVTVARVLLVGAAVQALSFICEESAKGLGRPGIAMRAELTGTIGSVVLLLAFVDRGLVPTALASTLGYLAGFVVAVTSLGRAAGVPVTALLRPRLGAVDLARAARPAPADG